MPVTSIVAQATGQTVLTYNAAAAGHQVIPANVAYIMDEITSNDNNRIREFGRNGYLTLNPRRVSAKTGTADFFMDNLTVGWTPNLLTAVWVGNAAAKLPPAEGLQLHEKPDREGQHHRGRTRWTTRIRSARETWRTTVSSRCTPSIPDCGHLDGVVSGYSGAAPIWHAYMSAALKGVPDTWYKQPADVVVGPGGGPGDDANFYLPGTQPGAQHQLHVLRPDAAAHRDLHLRRTVPGPAAAPANPTVPEPDRPVRRPRPMPTPPAH